MHTYRRRQTSHAVSLLLIAGSLQLGLTTLAGGCSSSSNTGESPKGSTATADTTASDGGVPPSGSAADEPAFSVGTPPVQPRPQLADGSAGCGRFDDGTVCECLDVPLFTNPPTIYFVLDRSGSMQQSDRWTSVRTTVANLMRDLGPRANFGASMFPGFQSAPDGGCTPPHEVLEVSPGDPIGTGFGPTATKLLAGTDVLPNGETPTAKALETALATLASRQSDSGANTYVILATDGAPTCRSADTIPAAKALYDAGFPVYVIGLPGTEGQGTLLDNLAEAGGTALTTSPKYYRVDVATEEASLLAALKRIAAKIVGTCTYQLNDRRLQPNLINVFVDDVVLPADPVNGWKLEDQTVTLVGQACERILSGDALNVRVVAGCPTVTPR